jgi:hypothetical protein
VVAAVNVAVQADYDIKRIRTGLTPPLLGTCADISLRLGYEARSRRDSHPEADARPARRAAGPDKGCIGRRDDSAMNKVEVKRWFGSYLADFVAMGRGEVEDVRRILIYYGIPMIISTDAACMFLADETQVLAAAQQQIDSMRSAGYDHSDVLAAETTVLNRSCAVHHGRFARIRADGTEISQIEATYLITDGAAGRRISALIVHSAR